MCVGRGICASGVAYVRRAWHMCVGRGPTLWYYALSGRRAWPNAMVLRPFRASGVAQRYGIVPFQGVGRGPTLWYYALSGLLALKGRNILTRGSRPVLHTARPYALCYKPPSIALKGRNILTRGIRPVLYTPALCPVLQTNSSRPVCA